MYNDWNPYEDAIAHYGTQGMKWGVRRYQYEDGSLTPLGRIHYGRKTRQENRVLKKQEKALKKEAEKSTKRAHELTKRDIKNMSTEELRAQKDRLQLEKDVLTLSSNVKDLSGSRYKSEGKSFIDGVLKDSNKRIMTTALTGAGIFLVANAGKYFVSMVSEDPENAKKAFEYLSNAGPKKK